MGNLLKETPYSEVTATLEVLDRWGVTRQHLAQIRRQPDGYGRRVAEFILRSSLELAGNPFDNEWVKSEYHYPDGYQPKPVADQLATLQRLYPQLDGSQVAALADSWDVLPDGTELLQVVPKLASVAKLHGIRDPYGKGYGRCLELMLGHIDKSRKFYNYREDRLTDRHVRLLNYARQTLERLEAETPGDYLVIPMQSGLLYAGSSVRRARWEIERSDQWPLPAWVIGHHLLTHPELEVQWEQLHLDCAGDEYAPGADGEFDYALLFSFDLGFGGGGLWFDAHRVDDAPVHWGSASGFLRE